MSQLFSKIKIAIYGNSEKKQILNNFNFNSYDLVLCLDGGFASLYQNHIIPHVLLGDFDSINKEELKIAENLGVKIVYTPDQNMSDLGKAIQYIIDLYQKSSSEQIIDIFNSLRGERLDHILLNCGYLKRFYHQNRKISFFDHHYQTFFVRNLTVKIQGSVGDDIAIMPITESYVTSKGLQYDMKDCLLAIGIMESSSNKMAKARGEITVDGECLIIHHQNIKTRLYLNNNRVSKN